MAKIIDPDSLVVSTTSGNLGVNGNIWLDTSAKTFELAPYGDLTSAKEGVTGNALWAKFVDLWTTSTYQPYSFPMNVLDAKSGQYIFGQDPGGTYNGWAPAGDVTRQMIRDAGWYEYSSGGVLNRQYVGIVSLGEVSTGAQLYYQKVAAGTAIPFTFTDEVNEGIRVDDTAKNYFKGYVREYGKKYKDSVLGDTGQSATGAYIVNLLLSNEDDLDITAIDGNVSTISPYTEINIKYFSGAYTKDVVSGAASNFGIVIDVGTNSGIDGTAPGGASVLTTAAGGMTVNAYSGGTLTIWEGTDKNVSFPIVSNTATTITVTGTVASGAALSFTAQRAVPVAASLKQIYTKVQYQLRQATDIDTTAGTVTGKTASLLLNFVGSSLKCGFYAPTNPNGGGSGVMVEGLAATDVNDIVFYDNTAASKEYPYTAAGTLNFNSALTNGSTGYYRMYFLNDDYGTNTGRDYGTATAITVKDKNTTDISGTINAGTINFTFDYDGNAQRGNTPPNTSPAGDAQVVVVAGNAGSAKPVVATGTITRSKSVSITLTAETDRAYLV
jgi:hypothetical protein